MQKYYFFFTHTNFFNGRATEAVMSMVSTLSAFTVRLLAEAADELSHPVVV